MVRNTKKTTTPGQETDIVLGIVSISESLQLKMQKDEQHDETLEKSIEQVILNTSSIEPYLATTANMLVAIAGYLFGNKNITSNMNPNALLSRIKNNAPILGDTPNSVFYKHVQKEMTEAKNNAKVETTTGNADLKAELTLIFENINENGLIALVDVLDAIRNNYGDVDLDSLESVIDAIDLLSELVDELNSSGIDKFDPSVQKGFERLSGSFDALFNINKLIMSNLGPSLVIAMFKSPILKSIKTIAEVISGTNGKGGMMMVFNHYEKLKAKKPNILIKQVTLFFKQLKDLFKSLITISMLSRLAGMGGSKGLKKAIKKANDIIDEIRNMDLPKNPKELKSIDDKIKSMSSIIVQTGKMIAVVAVAGLLAPLAAIGAFAMCLALIGIEKLINRLVAIVRKAKGAKDASQALKPIIGLVITIGVLMVIAALTGGLVLENAENILGFGLVFLAFSTLILGSLLLISKLFKKNAAAVIKEIRILVISMAIIMVLGAVFMMSGLWKEALKFGAILMVFVTMMLLPLLLFSKIGGRRFKGSMRDFAILVITCTFVLMIGAFFMMTNLWKEALKFGLVLTAFMVMIMLPLFIFSKIGGRRMKNTMRGFIWLIVTCTLVLIIGALFMQIPEFVDGAMKFALLLVGFILAIIVPIGLLGPKLNRAVRAMRWIVAIIITGTLCLMLGALFIEEYGWENVLIFAGILAGFIGIIAGIMALLSLIPKAQLTTGMIAMGVVAGVILLGSIAMIALGEAFQKFGNWKDALIMAGILCGVILAIGAMTVAIGFVAAAAALGMLAMLGIAAITVVMCKVMVKLAECNDLLNKITNNNPDKALSIISTMAKMIAAIGGIAIAVVPFSPFLILGLPVLGMIVGIALMVSKCLLNIGEALLMLQKVSAGDTDITKIKTMIMSFVEIAKALEEIDDAISPRILRRVARSMTAVGKMVSKLGISVQDVSNLKVATSWDRDGNPTGYRQLSTTDFENAAKNTKEIITTVGGAIIELYYGQNLPAGIKPETVKDMFHGTGIFGLGKSPFDKVVKSASGLGKMISKIAQGVAEISNLKVATRWDKEGNPISYVQLSETHFKAAANNTKEIISTLGTALIELYNKNEDLFKPAPVEVGFFGIKIKVPGKGETVFEKVAKSCSTLGNMMSLIANGVKDMADLKIATGWDSEGNPTGYRHLGKDDFINAATNVNNVTTTVMNELKNVYEKDTSGFFDTELTFVNGHLQTSNDCPAMRVVQVASEVGMVLTNIAKGLKEFADGRIKEYDKDGYETGAYVEIKWSTVATKASGAVSTVVTCVCDALEAVYKNREKLFKKTYESLASTSKSGVFSKTTTYTTVEHESPLMQVLKVAGGIGKMVEDIAVAVKKVQSLDFDARQWKIGGKYRGKTTTLVLSICDAVLEAHDSINKSFIAQGLGPFTGDNAQNTIQKIETFVNTSVTLSQNTAKAVLKIQNDLRSVNEKKFSEKWLNVVKGFVEPISQNFLTDDNNSKLSGFIGAITSENSKVDELVKSVNNLNSDKVDKFIELSAELRNLHDTIANFDGFIDALNGKINDTLNELSKKLELASKTIKESDTIADKRQETVKRNINELKSLMDKKMELEILLPEGAEMNDSNEETNELSGDEPGNGSKSESGVGDSWGQRIYNGLKKVYGHKFS